MAVHVRKPLAVATVDLSLLPRQQRALSWPYNTHSGRPPATDKGLVPMGTTMMVSIGPGTGPDDDERPELGALADCLATMPTADHALALALGKEAVPPAEAENATTALGLYGNTAGTAGLAELQWLMGPGPEPELARALVFGEGDVSKTICGKGAGQALDEPAGWFGLLAGTSELNQLVAYSDGLAGETAKWLAGRPWQAAASRYISSRAGTGAAGPMHAAALLAAGMAPGDVAPIALSGSAEVGTKELKMLVGGASPEVFANFLSGKYTRGPRHGEIPDLMAARSATNVEDRRALLRTRLDLGGAPWTSELFGAAPWLLAGGLQPGEVGAVYYCLASSLYKRAPQRWCGAGAKDTERYAKAWTEIIERLPSWGGTVDALVSTLGMVTPG